MLEYHLKIINKDFNPRMSNLLISTFLKKIEENYIVEFWDTHGEFYLNLPLEFEFNSLETKLKLLKDSKTDIEKIKEIEDYLNFYQKFRRSQKRKLFSKEELITNFELEFDFYAFENIFINEKLKCNFTLEQNKLFEQLEHIWMDFIYLQGKPIHGAKYEFTTSEIFINIKEKFKNLLQLIIE